MRSTMRGLASMTLLAGSLVLFGIFHFLPLYSNADEADGRAIWPELILILQDPTTFEDVLLSMAVASFLMFSLLVVASPFLGTIWNKSKPAWAMALTCSGLATAGFWLTSLANNDFDKLLPGGWCLMFAPVLNFFGLLISREENPIGGSSPP